MGIVAIVTGGSSGIGRETAKYLASGGVRVYEFSRREVHLEGIRHISVDVTDEAAVNDAVRQICETEGQIDILVSCAGYGIAGAVEYTRSEDAKRQLDVNFFGTVNCSRAVLPVMHRQGYGKIVCVSSVAGTIPIPFQTFYSVSKAAVNSYVTALANEVRPYGIQVCAVQPGDIASSFTDARVKSLEGDEEYQGRISRSIQVMEKDERNGMSAARVGAYIAGIALKKNLKPLYAAGLLYKFFCIVMRLLPCRFSNYLLYQIYGK